MSIYLKNSPKNFLQQCKAFPHTLTPLVHEVYTMEDKNTTRRNNNLFRHRQARKIIDRLTYIPKKHKQKKTRAMRQKLQDQTLTVPKPIITPTTIKFNSMNVNGLDVEACWAVQQLLDHRGFDVGYKFIHQKTNNNFHR